MTDGTAFLPYHEPGVTIILIQASLLLLLNVINSAINRLLYCGMLGQILVGVAWGTPGANFLEKTAEEVITQIGYLGLTLLVFEGGLSTSLSALRANLGICFGVALTGIALSIAASFILIPLVSPSASPLEAFAAGVSLCSTSLGTTFTVLDATGLSKSRLGVVLSASAMIDDVFGLVFVKVITNLSGGPFQVMIVIRPLFIAVAFVLVVLVVCWMLQFVLHRSPAGFKMPCLGAIIAKDDSRVIMALLLLVALVAGSSYAGTSSLFAAYIAGVALTWLDSFVAKKKTSDSPPIETDNFRDNSSTSQEPSQLPAVPTSMSTPSTQHKVTTDFLHLYQKCVRPAAYTILQPFFFASIGFSIPITRLFKAGVVWRGIIYAVLMILTKLVCGLWLVRLGRGWKSLQWPYFKKKQTKPVHIRKGQTQAGDGQSEQQPTSGTLEITAPLEFTGQRTIHQTPSAGCSPAGVKDDESSPSFPYNLEATNTPISLYPALILGTAMCARGEIGFLIASSATASNILSERSFLVVTWALVLCTLIGPLCMGILVRRVRKLQGIRGEGRNVLGVWGI